MTYSLRNDFILNSFTEELLSYINQENKTVSIRWFLEERLGFPLNGSFDFRLYGNKVIGRNFKSELLLYGFYCPDILNNQLAVHEHNGYYGTMNSSGTFVGIIHTSSFGGGHRQLYYVDRVLKKEVRAIELLYKQKVVELV